MNLSNIKRLELLEQISDLIEYDNLDDEYYINMNDMFAYGSSESKIIKDGDVWGLYEVFKCYGDLGILLYICIEEDMKPRNILCLNRLERKALTKLYKQGI